METMPATGDGGKIKCLECSKEFHQLSVHLGSVHKMTTAQYNAKYPGAPTVSAMTAAKVSASQRAASAAKPTMETAEPFVAAVLAIAEPPHKEAKEAKGRVVRETLTIGSADVPVFDGLSARDAACVPDHDPHYAVDEAVLSSIALGIELFENVLITGPTGVGKTSGIQELAAILNWPVTRINLTGDTRVGDIIGDIKVDIDQHTGQAYTRWEDGPLITAMRLGHITIIDEMDSANPAVLFVLQRVTERHHDPVAAVKAGRPHARLLLPDGSVVGAHPHFRLLATANTTGSGDMTGDYAATNVLNQAFLDRWGIKLRIGYPNEADWISILANKTGVDRGNARRIVQVAMKINKSKSDGQCRLQISPRRTITWARLAVKFGTDPKSLRRAAELTILNGIDALDPDLQFALDTIKHVAGT